MNINQKNMYLTKTDFMRYLQCPQSLWLLKHEPEVYPHKKFSDFLKKIVREGYEVERYAQMLFPDGVSLPPTVATALTKTKEALSKKTEVLFQPAVLTDDGLFARADILTRNDDNTYTLYEVKSSSSIKKGAGENHIKDACFQKITFERFGLPIQKVFIIHLNGDYVREVEIDPHELLKKVAVTDAVEKIYGETEIEINNALSLLQEEKIEERGCSCLRKTRSNHCDAFAYFNGAVPDHAIWEIGRLHQKKLCVLLDRGIQKIEDIPDDVDLNDRQRRQVQSVVRREPLIDEKKIVELLSTLVFPLYFFDYEAASSAVPKIIGTKPWQHIPFQYSLHCMHADGTLDHSDYLNETMSPPEGVLQALCKAVKEKGSIIAWHAVYEKTINKGMMAMYPQYREALQNINDRMFDLEDIFKEAYTDAAFCGSTSIKKVLPVLCPHLSYKHLAVQDGTQAMEQWFAMVEEEDPAEKTRIRNDLLAYCKLDTLAMVEIYNTITALV